MKKTVWLIGLVTVLAVILTFAVSPAPAQPDLEKEFMKKHKKEMAVFM